MADAATREVFFTDMEDDPAIRRSTKKVSDVAEREGAAFVVYGHDTDQWDTLLHSPEFYD